MEADFASDDVAAARIRRSGPGTFQRAPRTISAIMRGEQFVRLLSHHAGAVFPFTAATDSRRLRTAARRDDAEEPVAITGGGFGN